MKKPSRPRVSKEGKEPFKPATQASSDARSESRFKSKSNFSSRPSRNLPSDSDASEAKRTYTPRTGRSQEGRGQEGYNQGPRAYKASGPRSEQSKPWKGQPSDSSDARPRFRSQRPEGDGPKADRSRPWKDQNQGSSEGRGRYQNNKPAGEGSSFEGPRTRSEDTRRPYRSREGDAPNARDNNRENFKDKRSEGPRSAPGADRFKNDGKASNGTYRGRKMSDKEVYKSRNRFDPQPERKPNYRLDEFKENAKAKIRKKIKESESQSPYVRLNRFIANAGICSRRDADELISAGQIKVNNKVVTEMGYKVGPTDVVKYGNRKLNREKATYVLLNKPKDFITTTEDPNDRKTVMELVKNATEFRIYPVGRLDRNTTGLLLLTNDGELAEKLTHPSNQIEKIYQVELDKALTKEDFDRIKEGLTLEDGPIEVDELAYVTPDGYVMGIKIHSGRNRIVRRIFEHLGYQVSKLDRTSFAGLNKKDLPRGTWRYLTEREVIKLKYFV